jgi:hypothetical protein
MRLPQLDSHLLNVFRRLVGMSVCGPTLLQESSYSGLTITGEAKHNPFPAQSHTARKARSWTTDLSHTQI